VFESPVAPAGQGHGVGVELVPHEAGPEVDFIIFSSGLKSQTKLNLVELKLVIMDFMATIP
jgi:hypothetical protein